MQDFTVEEINLMCIYNTGNREKLIGALKEMKGYLNENDSCLLTLSEGIIHRLEKMTDADFEQVQDCLFPDFI